MVGGLSLNGQKHEPIPEVLKCCPILAILSYNASRQFRVGMQGQVLTNIINTLHNQNALDTVSPFTNLVVTYITTSQKEFSPWSQQSELTQTQDSLSIETSYLSLEYIKLETNDFY